MSNIGSKRFTGLLVILLVSLLSGIWFYFQNYKFDKVVSTLNLGSNFSPELKLVSAIGGLGVTGASSLNEPMAVDVSQDGKIYVLDTGNSQVKVFDQTGKLEFLFGDKSSFYLPSDIVVTNDRVYIADPKNMRVQLFNLKGEFIKTVISAKDLGKSIGAFIPAAVFVNEQGQLFVTDVFYHRVLAFDLQGKLLFQFGRPGSKSGQLLYPNGITVDSEGRLIVADSNNRRLQLFSNKGKFIGVLKQDNQPVGLNMPRGLAVSAKNNLYVAETFGHQVIALNVGGNQVHDIVKLGKRGTGPEELNFPNDVAIRNGLLCVADRANDRVLVYKLIE